MRWRVRRLAVVALCMAASWPGASAEPVSILDLVAAVGRAEPLTEAKVAALLGTPLRCDDGFCKATPVATRELLIGQVDFRHGAFGSLLILDRFSGSCLPVERVRTRYPGGHITQGCSDALCWYDEIERPWGTLSFGLGHPAAPPAITRPGECVTSVIAKGRR